MPTGFHRNDRRHISRNPIHILDTFARNPISPVPDADMVTPILFLSLLEADGLQLQDSDGNNIQVRS